MIDKNDPYGYIADFVLNSFVLYGAYIVRLKIDNIISNELLIYDSEDDDYVWQNDWYEGAKEVCLLGYIPVDCVPAYVMTKRKEWEKWRRS